MLSTTAEFLRFSTKGIGNFSNTWNKIIKRIPNCNKHKKDERGKGGIPYTTVKCHCDTICGNKTIHFQQGRAEKQKKKTQKLHVVVQVVKKYIYWMVAVDRDIAIYVPIEISHF